MCRSALWPQACSCCRVYHTNILCYADVKRLLDLHAKYEAKKVELIGQMSVEVGIKPHIEVQLEKKYLEIDAEVSIIVFIRLY